MMGDKRLNDFKRRWQQMQYTECALYAVGVAGLFYLASQSFYLGFLGFVVGMAVALLLFKPWKLSAEQTVAYVDAHVPEAGYSSGLLMLPQSELSNLSKLQRYRVETQLDAVLTKLKPPHQLPMAAMAMFGLIMIGLAIQFMLKEFQQNPKTPSTPQNIQFAPLDSVETNTAIPKLSSTKIIINQPDYTGIAIISTENPNISAVTGTVISWQLEFDGEVSNVQMDRMGELFSLTKRNGGFILSQTLEASGFYSFSFEGANGNKFVTDLYSMEAIEDQAPLVEIDGLDQYSYFEYNEVKQLPLNTKVSDDFGINGAYIVATVSKGSGESVKFREETIRFDGTLSKGKKQLQLKKLLDLDKLKMDPGDELYFYVEALDNKIPSPNISRSETYFAVIRDTITDDFAVESTLGVDQMPDYFRSQRQLIIDTEKLIKDKPNLPEKDFKFKSNELGFDQKSLRLKYGQFMGDETELQAAPGQVSSVESEHEGEEGEEKDLLDAYSHKHDSDNEHNLVEEHEGHNEEGGEEEEDPLHDYLHNHDDPEESTLFEKSLKAKLRDALSIMWDAELYLRLYQPEKSLPYQYKALKIIQEIKNSARIYVHRIGFDPPPIKEEKRLTGNIETITNFDKKQEFDHQMSFASSRKTVSRLEQLIQGSNFTEMDRVLFQDAGNELAKKAVEEPLKYLKVLQGLRDLDKSVNRTRENYTQVQKGLLSVLPQVENNPGKMEQYDDEINRLFINELGKND
ncbi:tryptophan-rich sensory protein [Flagellimonas sediminis]|uniref:Tryptophan-rich sensory protein n=1 Tax=Flagellimonas sediminis TaxID=2696468 RepID=A0A6I5L2G7_9FLAO|nr:tryptophan-rich sensory protein [Allomuricauda sediminis]NDV44722.1 tryptophan-rich sensory protein [Allomuricauda sediminis]